jgi:hypothetical protein
MSTTATDTLKQRSADANIISGGHLAAKALKNEGVDTIFTLCGGHIIDIYDGCLDEGIRIVDVRHEQVAAHAADGYARQTGKLGCVVTTAGPAFPGGSRVARLGGPVGRFRERGGTWGSRIRHGDVGGGFAGSLGIAWLLRVHLQFRIHQRRANIYKGWQPGNHGENFRHARSIPSRVTLAFPPHRGAESPCPGIRHCRPAYFQS